MTKRQHVKKSFDLLLLYLYNRFFLVLEVLYERSRTTFKQYLNYKGLIAKTIDGNTFNIKTASPKAVFLVVF